MKHRPDCLICDGQGLAHPRRMRLAAHLGLIVGLPSIGCGKTKLLGKYQEPGTNKGDRSCVLDQEELVRTVLRTRKGVKLIFISQGHRMTLNRAVEIVLSCQRHATASRNRFGWLIISPTRHDVKGWVLYD